MIVWYRIWYFELSDFEKTIGGDKLHIIYRKVIKMGNFYYIEDNYIYLFLKKTKNLI